MLFQSSGELKNVAIYRDAGITVSRYMGIAVPTQLSMRHFTRCVKEIFISDVQVMVHIF